MIFESDPLSSSSSFSTSIPLPMEGSKLPSSPPLWLRALGGWHCSQPAGNTGGGGSIEAVNCAPGGQGRKKNFEVRRPRRMMTATEAQSHCNIICISIPGSAGEGEGQMAQCSLMAVGRYGSNHGLAWHLISRSLDPR